MKRFLLLGLLATLALGLFAQGTIVVWGSPHPQVQNKVPAGDDFIEISAGNDYAIALRQNGTLAGWGTNSTAISQIPAGNNFVKVAAGDRHVLALRSDGTVAAWGLNNNGQANIPPHSDYVKIAAGIDHSLAIRANGEVYAWGSNAGGKCTVPAGQYTDIAAGSNTSVAINAAGQLVAWGGGYNGETTVPSGNDFVQVSGTYIHFLARRSNGTIVAWGNQTGNLDVPAGTYMDMTAGWQGNVAIRTDETLAAWANLWALKTIPAWVTELSIVKVSAGNKFNLGLTGVFAEDDADSDGVADNLDEFPTDPLRAYSLSYPLTSETGWGTLAFEDMWPQKGDYDFNDLVVDYRITQIMDADYKVKDIQGEFMLRAVGATFQNAFAIEFPFPTTNIESLTGEGAGAEYNMPIIIAGTNSILKVISNTNDFVNVPGHDVFWNTQLEQPTYAAIPISFSLTLSEPYDMNLAPFWGLWNPYLMVNRVQGHEIHLPGYPPTIHANPDLFGLNDDTTNPAANRYYKTASNLPWALDLPISWRYPIELKQITHAYYGFAPWAESGGASYQNWYELIPAQINLNYIYNR